MCFSKKKKNIQHNEDKKVENKQENVEIKEQEEKERTTKKGVYRVVFDKEDKLWKIKKDGAKRVIDSKKTKDEALKRVQELSESQDTKFVVYKKDGKFQKKANLKIKND